MRIMRFLGRGRSSPDIRTLAVRMLFNKKMKTDVWALVGIVVTTIQVQQVTH
jgi:hypothetical protein